jgi:hypothetical protein
MSIRPVTPYTKVPTPAAHLVAGKPVKANESPKMDVRVGRPLPADTMPGHNPQGSYFTERYKVIQPDGSSSEYVLIKQDLSSYQTSKTGGAKDKTIERIDIPKGFTSEFVDNDENGKVDRIRFVHADIEPGENANQTFGTSQMQEYIIAPKTAKKDLMNL